jgi:hypothetical protein
MLTDQHLPSIVPKLVLQVLWRPLLLWVILILAPVMIIIHLLRALLRMVLRLLPVHKVGALGLSETVDFGASEAGEQFFSEGMRDSLACVPNTSASRI